MNYIIKNVRKAKLIQKSLNEISFGNLRQAGNNIYKLVNIFNWPRVAAVTKYYNVHKHQILAPVGGAAITVAVTMAAYDKFQKFRNREEYNELRKEIINSGINIKEILENNAHVWHNDFSNNFHKYLHYKGYGKSFFNPNIKDPSHRWDNIDNEEIRLLANIYESMSFCVNIGYLEKFVLLNDLFINQLNVVFRNSKDGFIRKIFIVQKRSKRFYIEAIKADLKVLLNKASLNLDSIRKVYDSENKNVYEILRNN